MNLEILSQFPYAHKFIVPELRDFSGVSARLWFTSGCFDLFHYGHLCGLLEMGRRAHKEDCHLMVAVNSSKSVEELKGRKTIVPDEMRMCQVAAIEVVDYVTIFDDPRPTKLIRTLSPNAIVHGHSPDRPAYTCRDELKGYTGRVLAIPHVGDWSTTRLKEKIFWEEMRSCTPSTSWDFDKETLREDIERALAMMDPRKFEEEYVNKPSESQ